MPDRESLLSFRRAHLILPTPLYWVSLVPFAILVFFVAHFTVNVPYMDQWGLPWLFGVVANHGFRLRDYWFLNNEHRVFFPNLIWAGLAFTTKWNVLYDVYLILVLGLATFTMIYKIAKRQRMPDDGTVFAFAMITTSLLVFSWIQYENWLWGYELAFMLVQTCLAAAIFVGTNPILSGPTRVLLAALFSTVGSYSAAQGLLLWPALVPVLVASYPRARLKVLAFWSGLFLLCAAVYFIGFHFPAFSPNANADGFSFPDPFYAFKHPQQAIVYFFTLVGAPFAHGLPRPPATMALVMGIVLVGTFLVLTFLSRASWSNSAPWISMGVFGLAFAFLNTIGRSGWGTWVAINVSRYTSGILVLSIATVQIGRFLCKNKSHVALYSLACLGLVALIVPNSAYSVQKATEFKNERILGEAVLPFLQYIDPATDASPQSCLMSLFPLAPLASWVRQPAQIAERLGFRKLIHNASFDEAGDAIYGSLDTAIFAPSITVKHDSTIDVRGWALSSQEKSSRPLVLFSHDDSKLFMTATLAGARENSRTSVLTSQNGRSDRSAWEIQVPASFLPLGNSLIKAWIYAPDRNRFVRLLNELRVTVLAP